MAQAKVETIAGGTMKACRRLVMFRFGVRQMADEHKLQQRIIHPILGIPVPITDPVQKEADTTEEKLLTALAEDYRVNPGLFMAREDLKRLFEVDDKTLDMLLSSLEVKGDIKLYRSKKGIELAKATYEGLRKANSLEYYRWFPSWIDRARCGFFDDVSTILCAEGGEFFVALGKGGLAV